MMLKDLGEKQGRLLVFGGVYSNLQALETLQEIAEKEKIVPSNIICTGDIVGYCAEPEASVAAIRDWGIHTIAGNVEVQLRDEAEDCGCDFTSGGRCDVFSRQWYPYAQQQVSKESIAWMEQLPLHLRFHYAGKTWVVVHGSYQHIAEFIFKSTPWEVKQANLEASRATNILAGHCGLPFHDQSNGSHWINPGVIGMPANDGTARVWYGILEETQQGWSFTHQSFTYNHQRAAKLMLQNQLPLSYAQTLSSGIWDNCEILPDEETGNHGVRMVF